MNNEYCMEGESWRTTEGTAQTGSTKVRSCALEKVGKCSKSMFMNPMFITFIIIFIFIAFMIYWYYVRPNWYKKFYKKLQGFKYSHLISQEEEQGQEITPAVNNTNRHYLLFGSSGSGMTFLIFLL